MTPDQWQVFLETLQGLSGPLLNPTSVQYLRSTAHELAIRPNPFAVIDELTQKVADLQAERSTLRGQVTKLKAPVNDDDPKGPSRTRKQCAA